MKCNCGNEFEGNFCPNCGKSKEEILQSRKSDKVKCRCGNEFEGKFCPVCGEMRPQNRSVNVENNNQNAVSLEKRNINAGNNYQNTSSQPNNSFNSGNNYQNTVPPQSTSVNQVLTIQNPRTVKDWFKSGLSKAFFLNIIVAFLMFFLFQDIISGCVCLFSAIIASPFLYIKFDLFSDRNLTKKERIGLNIVIVILDVVAGWFFEAGISALGTLIINFWLLYLLNKNLSREQWKVTKIITVFVVLGVIVASGYQMAENQKQQNQQITTYYTDTITADTATAQSKVELYTENATDSNSNNDDNYKEDEEQPVQTSDGTNIFYLNDTISFKNNIWKFKFDSIYFDRGFFDVQLICDIVCQNTSDTNQKLDINSYSNSTFNFNAYNNGLWASSLYSDYDNQIVSPGKTFNFSVKFNFPKNANVDIMSEVCVTVGSDNAIVLPYKNPDN